MINNKLYKCISIGPSLVDMLFYIDSSKYDVIRNTLKAKPGDWISVDDFTVVEYLFFLITGRHLPKNGSELIELYKHKIINLSAGSTNLGVFSAFPKSMRNDIALISSVGCKEGVVDPISSFFSNALKDLSIKHFSYPVEGNNPLGIVISSPDVSEKILITYPGIASKLKDIDNIKSEILYIDSYELVTGNISTLINRLILSKKYKIALGLGNIKILKGKLREKIREYINQDLVYCISGNENEFRQLEFIQDFSKIRTHKFFKKVENILITHGENGLTGVFGDNILFRESMPSDKIISTSGAGDIATGVFISGIIAGDDTQKILSDAVFYASEILNYQESILPGGRP